MLSSQVGSGAARAKPGKGVPTQLGIRKRITHEFPVTPDALLPLGLELRAHHFAAGQKVDITGTTIGKGFQGAMKRHGFKGGPASHGASLSHRSLGATGACQDPGRVAKGKKMAGRMGGKQRTLESAYVYKVKPFRCLPLTRSSSSLPLCSEPFFSQAREASPIFSSGGLGFPGRRHPTPLASCSFSAAGRRKSSSRASCVSLRPYPSSFDHRLLPKSQLLAASVSLPSSRKNRQGRSFGRGPGAGPLPLPAGAPPRRLFPPPAADLLSPRPQVDPVRNLLYIQGSIPGHRGNHVFVRDAHAYLKGPERDPGSEIRPFPAFTGEQPTVVTVMAGRKDPFAE